MIISSLARKTSDTSAVFFHFRLCVHYLQWSFLLNLFIFTTAGDSAIKHLPILHFSVVYIFSGPV